MSPEEKSSVLRKCPGSMALYFVELYQYTVTPCTARGFSGLTFPCGTLLLFHFLTAAIKDFSNYS